MENASKALIMAGAVLIAILIISLAVLVFNNFSKEAEEAANLDQETISAFNSKITPYLGKSIPGSQVNALLQYSLANNMTATQNSETHKYITITLEGSTILDGDSTSYTKVSTSGTYYTVVGTYDNNGLLTTIAITKN